MHLIDQWPVWLSAIAALILQGIWLRVVHRRHLLAVRSEHQQVLSAMHGKVEQMTQRLRQLQRDQAASESATARAGRAAASADAAALSAIAARQALERELAADSDERQTSTSDGFADTQILPQEDQSSGLLLQRAPSWGSTSS